MLVSRLYSAALVGPLLSLGSFGVAQESAPCDTSTQACLNVMMANACLAAYIRGGNATEILRCVNVDDQAVARDELCACYGCTEPIIRQWVTSGDVCQLRAS